MTDAIYACEDELMGMEPDERVGEVTHIPTATNVARTGTPGCGHVDNLASVPTVSLRCVSRDENATGLRIGEFCS